jgi:hypothetical protein
MQFVHILLKRLVSLVFIIFGFACVLAETSQAFAW